MIKKAFFMPKIDQLIDSKYKKFNEILRFNVTELQYAVKKTSLLIFLRQIIIPNTYQSLI